MRRNAFFRLACCTTQFKTKLRTLIDGTAFSTMREAYNAKIDEAIEELSQNRKKIRFAYLVRICQEHFGWERVRGSRHILRPCVQEIREPHGAE